MKPFNRSLALLLGSSVLSTIASAQTLTEIRISTRDVTGVSVDMEYAEILGTPGQSTDGLMLCAVEADDTNPALGELERVYDLSGSSFGAADQYYVFGSDSSINGFPAGTFDNMPVGENLFENSGQTFYLLLVPDPGVRLNISQVLLNTDIRTAPGATTTILPNTPGITVLDAVSFRNDPTDVVFDGAPAIGPDGNFMPSGALRTGGCPGDWCTDVFLNFEVDGIPNPPYADPTPGAQNPVTSCATAMSVGSCTNNNATFGTPYCTAIPNGTGQIGTLIGTGSILVSSNSASLVAMNLTPNQFGFFVNSRLSGFVPNPGGSNGNLCLGGSIGRFDDAGEIKNTGSGGTFTLDLDLTAIPRPSGSQTVIMGETWFFQAWHREPAVVGTSNFTRGLEITFL